MLKDKSYGSKKEKIVIIVLFLLLISSIIASCYFYSNSKNTTVITEYEQSVNQITEIDYSKRQEELDQIVEDGMINIQYSAYASFDGKVSTSFNVKNIKNNKEPIVFSIFDENGDIIYESKKIELGYEINSIELNKELSNGIHDCKIKIGYSTEGNVASMFPITIEVK